MAPLRKQRAPAGPPNSQAFGAAANVEQPLRLGRDRPRVGHVQIIHPASLNGSGRPAVQLNAPLACAQAASPLASGASPSPVDAETINRKIQQILEANAEIARLKSEAANAKGGRHRPRATHAKHGRRESSLPALIKSKSSFSLMSKFFASSSQKRKDHENTPFSDSPETVVEADEDPIRLAVKANLDNYSKLGYLTGKTNDNRKEGDEEMSPQISNFKNHSKLNRLTSAPMMQARRTQEDAESELYFHGLMAEDDLEGIDSPRATSQQMSYPSLPVNAMAGPPPNSSLSSETDSNARNGTTNVVRKQPSAMQRLKKTASMVSLSSLFHRPTVATAKNEPIPEADVETTPKFRLAPLLESGEDRPRLRLTRVNLSAALESVQPENENNKDASQPSIISTSPEDVEPAAVGPPTPDNQNFAPESPTLAVVLLREHRRHRRNAAQDLSNSNSAVVRASDDPMGSMEADGAGNSVLRTPYRSTTYHDGHGILRASHSMPELPLVNYSCPLPRQNELGHDRDHIEGGCVTTEAPLYAGHFDLMPGRGYALSPKNPSIDSNEAVTGWSSSQYSGSSGLPARSIPSSGPASTDHSIVEENSFVMGSELEDPFVEGGSAGGPWNLQHLGQNRLLHGDSNAPIEALPHFPPF